MRRNTNCRRTNDVSALKKIASVKLIVILLIALVCSLGYVRIKAEQIRLGYEISSNSLVERDLIRKRQNLQALYIQLKSPERLEYIARNRGFKFPTQNDVIFVEQPTTVVGNIK